LKSQANDRRMITPSALEMFAGLSGEAFLHGCISSLAGK
jgi:hypothetical protein